MVNEYKKFPMETAYDLKGKLRALMINCSDFQAYLDNLINKSQTVNNLVHEQDAVLDSKKKESQDLSRRIEEQKAEHARHQQEFEISKSKDLLTINQLKSSTLSDKDEAVKNLEESRKIKAELEHKIMEYDKRKLDLEERFSKIKNLAS